MSAAWTKRSAQALPTFKVQAVPGGQHTCRDLGHVYRKTIQMNVYGLLIAVASLVVEHGLQGTQASVVVATSLVAPWHVGSSGTSDQSVSPALAGEFLTTGPPVLSLSVVSDSL